MIDTSNLTDHLGAINVLVATAPLLSAERSSTLYTEVLVKQGDNLKDLADSMICGDFTTMSMLFGLLPIEYLTNATSISNMEDRLMNIKISSNNSSDAPKGQLRSRIVWKKDIVHATNRR